MHLWYALRTDPVDLLADRLARRLGPVRLRPWSQPPACGGILLFAPHDYARSERATICAAAPWAWVHLTSAGTDFLDPATWPAGTLLTRSWRCYAAPLAEYALHAILTWEWRGAAPWQVADPRPAPGAAGAPGLWGARIGVAGWGEVGRRVATTVRALGAEVVVLRRIGPDETTRGVEVTRDPRAVVDVDHLVVALPLNSGTRGLFDAAVLDDARRGLHLVNLSRPEVVDQDGLLRLCADGRLAATLDVTEPEPLPLDHPLRSLPSVRLSPHIAWRSRSSGIGYVEDFADLVTALRAHSRPPAAAWSAGSMEAAAAAASAARGARGTDA